jgi:hypothetical protein
MSDKILAAAIGLIATCLSAWGTIFIREWLNKKNKSVSGVLAAEGAVLQLMNDLAGALGASCQRVLVIKTHNGGGEPQYGMNIYSTEIQQFFNPPNNRVEKWSKLLLDSNSRSLVSKALTTEIVHIVVSSIQYETQIRLRHEKYGVKQSVLALLHKDDNVWRHKKDSGCYFLSIHFDSGDKLSASQRVTISEYVGKIRNVIKKQI